MSEGMKTATALMFHSDLVLQQWHQLDNSIGISAEPVSLNGRRLTIAQVISIARFVDDAPL